MAAGGKPKPTALKTLEGNPGKGKCAGTVCGSDWIGNRDWCRK